MFRKSPYWGWLLLALLLWGAAAWRYRHQAEHLRPASMARDLSDDLQRRMRALGTYSNNDTTVKTLFTGRPANLKELEAAPFYLFAYQGDSLVFWNTNEVLPPLTLLQEADGKQVTDLDGHRVLPKAVRYGGGRTLLALIPLGRSYQVENKYLTSRFLSCPFIPPSSELVLIREPGSFPVTDAAGHTLFYLLVHSEDIAPLVPDGWLIGFSVAALMCSLIWLQLLILFFTRKKSYKPGVLITVLLVVGLRALVYKLGLPFGLDNTPLFSSELYGYSWFLPSLGDLMLNALCFFWIVVFIMTQSPYRSFFRDQPARWYHYILAWGLLLLLSVYLFSIIPVLRSVVVDSQLSFDVSRFHAIDSFTILGLFTIVLLASLAGLVIHCCNILAGNLVRRRPVKYLVLALALIPLVLIAPADLVHWHLCMALWVFLFVFILDLPRMGITPDLFSPSMVFWSVFICASVTALMIVFIHARERGKDRIAFASHVVGRQDLLMEYNFQGLGNSLEHDEVVRAFVAAPGADKRAQLDEYLGIHYFSKQLNQYQPTLYIFDAAGKALYNTDTSSEAMLTERLNQGFPSIDPRLFFNENATDNHFYLALLELRDSLDNPVASLFLDLELKHMVNETLYPELLQPANINKAQGLADYDYAVYTGGNLSLQKGNYAFPVSIPESALPQKEYEFRKTRKGDELWYFNQGRLVIVADANQLWLETTTLFSYLFGLQMLVSLIVMLYRFALEYFLRPRGKALVINFTLRGRIHFAMLAMVLISFLVIGSVTIYFFSSRYQSNSYSRLQSSVKSLERELLQYTGNMQQLTPAGFDTLCHTSAFKRYIGSLSENQNVDLSLFDPEGRLLTASQEDVYAKNLLAPMMRPDAFAQMRSGRSTLLQRENIGGLFYLSCYVALQNERGTVLGYLNVPFYASEKELNDQISGILVALINLYAFLFLLSSMLALLITRGLTRTLNIIIQQFERLNLQRNELLEWPYDDEIGLLVREYNKMVRKVEENAALLAHNEREGAWREMARQVAHEIKNPLTPMKLNIQYLQQALKNNHPRLQELMERVSGTLIEQIDHLSHIASEFSNFARMPDARPEVLDINKVLHHVVDLFRNEPGVTLEADIPAQPTYVHIDRSQMIRVYTNLLQNAIQALEGKQNGRVEVSLQITEGHVLTAVMDNGKGIAPDLQDRLFKPYFTTKTSGTGLGLAMSRKIVELWKGSIWFESEEGSGTTFFIRLPLSTDVPEE